MKFVNYSITTTVTHWKSNWKSIILFLAILLLGIFARAWEFRSLPPGLNQDEASIGVEAYSLLHYGVDRHNQSFPVYFIAWGAGQNTLYGYLLVPFIWLFGLSPTVVRFPMLLLGIATLILVFLAARRLWNEQFGLLSMFFLAISPWHILLSRWGLEANLLPFTFLAGFTSLLYSKDKPKIFYIAMLFFALSFYSYGTAYVVVPLFILIATPILLKSRWLDQKTILIGLLIFVLVSIPIGLYIIVNTLKLQPIQFGIITIPRLPAQKTRYEFIGAAFGKNPLSIILLNAKVFFKLLLTQTDGKLRNTVEPYGYFYLITFPLAVLGSYYIYKVKEKTSHFERRFLLAWLFTGFVLGFLQLVNVNRMNILFIPLIITIAFCIYWLLRKYKYFYYAVIVAFAIAFAFFTRDYHSFEHQQNLRKEFYTGFLPAVEMAVAIPDVPVCITTEKLQGPFIFVLFAKPLHPDDYLDTMVYTDPYAQSRLVEQMTRYTFGLDYCSDTSETVYVLFKTERPPRATKFFEVTKYDRYWVYVPKQ